MKLKRCLTWAVLLLFLFSIFTVSNHTTTTVSGTNVSGPINTNTTWKLSKSPYVVKGDITVKPGAVLTIDAGVVVKFNKKYLLEIQGTLLAKGDYWGGKNITITSGKSSPNKADWKEIYFTSDDSQIPSTISNCSIIYADTGLHFKQSHDHLVEQCIINNVNTGIYIQKGRRILIRNCTVDAANKAVKLINSNNNKIRTSNITAGKYSLYLEGTNGTTIRRNNLSSANNGLYLDSSGKNIIRFNDIYNNNVIGLTLDKSNDNKIDQNNIMKNVKQLSNISSINQWSVERYGRMIGNYWSDYAGSDNGSSGRTAGDGIGDTDLPHLGVDWYPVIHHNGWDNFVPTVRVLSPIGTEAWRGVQTILWNATDLNNDELTIDLFYSSNNGSTWTIIESGHMNTGAYAWDTSTLSDGVNYFIKLIASDCKTWAENRSEIVFTIDNTPPEAIITFNNTTKRIEIKGVDNLDPNVEIKFWDLPSTNDTNTSKIPWWKKWLDRFMKKLIGKWVLRGYLLTDDAGNSINLTLSVKDRYGLWFKHENVKILNITYNNKTPITPPANNYDVSYRYSWCTGKITRLCQYINVYSQFKVLSSYYNISWCGKLFNMSNKTRLFITNETSGCWKLRLLYAKKQILPGLRIVELITNDGKIEYQY